MHEIEAPGPAANQIGDDTPVLVVVLKDPADLVRARAEGWYRIPLARLPQRVAADYLAFYLTGGFPPEVRWAVRWLAPVLGYHLATRRDLIPEEPDHPRAGDLYYRITLGALEPLPRPIPSRRLRRITFIATTLARLQTAEEINDLWIKSTAQERLWSALRRAGADAERQYPLWAGADGEEDEPGYPGEALADFAVPGPVGGTALIVADEPRAEGELHEAGERSYLPAPPGWRVIYARQDEIAADPERWAQELRAARPL